MPEAPKLDGFTDDDLRETVAKFAGVGQDAGLEDVVQFLRGVARAVDNRRKEASNTGESGIGVFLLAPGAIPSSPRIPDRLGSCPMLDNGLNVLGGRLWVVSKTVNSGKWAPLPDGDDQDAFDLISEIKLDDVPAVIFDPRTSPPSLRYYPRGLRETDSCEVLGLGRGPITPEEVFDVIDVVYHKILVTPEAQPSGTKLWKNAREFKVHDEAEVRIQAQLITAFLIAFPLANVSREQTQVSGRIDIEIETFEAGKLVRHVLLELKVLRARWSSGTSQSEASNMTWVKEGVEQASAYGTERKSVAKALCCFDMRRSMTGDACFNHVRETASNLGVLLKSWYLFNASKAYRQHLAAAGSPSSS